MYNAIMIIANILKLFLTPNNTLVINSHAHNSSGCSSNISHKH